MFPTKPLKKATTPMEVAGRWMAQIKGDGDWHGNPPGSIEPFKERLKLIDILDSCPALRPWPFPAQGLKQLVDPLIIGRGFWSDILVTGLERLESKLHIRLCLLKAYRNLIFRNSRNSDIAILGDPKYVVARGIVTCSDQFT
jgi:hypothetical protein